MSLAWLADEFEGKFLDQIGTAELAEFERKRRVTGALPPTVRRDLACLSSVFGSCIEWEWCDANPVPAYPKRRKKRGLREAPARTRYLSHEEELRYSPTPRQRYGPPSRSQLTLGLGARSNSNSLGQDRPPSGEILLDGNTKSGKPRRVPLLPRSAQILAQLPRHIRSPYVFCHGNGDRYVNMEKGLKAAVRRAGIRALRWHDFDGRADADFCRTTASRWRG